MKKLIALISLLALPVFGADWLSQSFFANDVRSIVLGTNDVTGTIVGVTNLKANPVFVGGLTPAKCTNIVGTVWTNAVGTSNTVVNGDLTKTNFNLLADVGLFPARDGGPPMASKLLDVTTQTTWLGTNFVYGTETAYSTPASVTVKLVCKGAISGNAGALLVFQPITGDDDMQSDITKNWIVKIPSVASTNVCFTTNAPMYKWGGYKKLRLVSITNPGADETEQLAVTEVKFNAFIP